MDRFIDSIEWIAAIFVGVVAADVFISILLRYFFGYSIPDSYDFGRLLLGQPRHDQSGPAERHPDIDHDLEPRAVGRCPGRQIEFGRFQLEFSIRAHGQKCAAQNLDPISRNPGRPHDRQTKVFECQGESQKRRTLFWQGVAQQRQSRDRRFVLQDWNDDPVGQQVLPPCE